MGRRRGSRPRARRTEGDILGHAGWVYSDLLLGIAVVFLSAVSFQAIIPLAPEDFSNDGDLEEQAIDIEESEPEACLAGISLVHIEVELPHALRGEELAERASSEMDRLLQQEFDQPLEGTTFGLMLVFGGHPDSGIGTARAARISDEILAVLPDPFEQVVTRAYWGGRGLGDRVRLDLFPYITEPCEND
jgi:hypothetical protein